MADFDWYDYRAILSRAALWSIISGPRSIGKTFGAKRDAVKRFLATGSQTMWIRRTYTALRPAKAGFFDGIAELYPGFDFRVESDLGQIRMEYSEEDKPGEWQTIIRFAALSVSSQLKGTEFPEVDWIVYDECFTDDTTGEPYLPEEVERLRNLWVTVNRSRKGKDGRAKTRVLLLGNATELDNPYFLEFYFDASREWQKYDGGNVVLHLVDASKYEQRVGQSVYGKVLGTVAAGYGSGEYFRPDGGLVVPAREPDAKPYYTLVTDRGTFGVWRTPDQQKMFVTPGPLADKNAPSYTFEIMKVRPGTPLADGTTFIRRETRRQYKRGSLFFVTSAAMAARKAIAR